MISDVFCKRYPHLAHHLQDVPNSVIYFFRQAAAIIFEDLSPVTGDFRLLCNDAYLRLCREVGYGLCQANDIVPACRRLLCEPFDMFNHAHGLPSTFILNRLSMIELLMRDIEAEIGKPQPKPTWGFSTGIDRVPVLRKAIYELNHRFREAKLPLHYHNGMLQVGEDKQTMQEIHEPFWELVKDAKWNNVDTDMKEAIDRRDSKGRDAALYASKALESTIKIISDEKGWSTGNEKGAANYIDNLVSQKNGRFIDPWESEMLKLIFREVRNPHGHGPGSEPLPELKPHQETLAIETAMVWIKSLVSRL